MIEIGVALANHKQVYIFYDSRVSADPPFYLDKIPFESYASEDELRLKLRKVKRDTC